ncbi:HelD family protein [Luteimicrobium sp. NPDC057192]|uniref:HelD family protein n=1 Tax=Luteimicrobium sp. NPDC057192 TaxID=3346042 RepID=UPI00362B18C6
MGEQFGRVGQVAEEQRSIDAMYARLDAEVGAKLAAQERAMAASVGERSDLYARDLEVAQLAGSVGRLRAAEQSLCFGRIDGAGGSWHVGRVGLRTESGEVLLVDWRADAARPFYAATLAAPLGVRRRRHLRLDGRTVVELTDEVLDGTAPTEADVVGDGPLVSALSAARTGRMNEAAATLQAEQDAIVRSPHRGVMVVDGGPGTGKTIVALHRAAYVLYAFPSIADRGVLVFGPNQRFLTYIADVLPSLGENDVRLATMPDVVGVEATRDEPDRVARLKGRAACADGLARWVQRHEPDGVPLELTATGETVVLDAALVDVARRRALEGGVGHNRARARFVEHVVDDLVNELERRTAQEVTDFEDELEALGIDLDRIAGKDSRHDAPADGLGIDWDAIRDQLLDDPAVDRAIDQVWPRLRAADVVRGFLGDPAALAAALPGTPDDVALLAASAGEGWSSADLALLDEARALVDGLPEAVYGHVVVDEAQLLSEMQWRALVRRCPGRSMTIVGDLAQAGPTTTVRSWDELSAFVGDGFAHHRLTINYRTTAEILESTEPLLAEIAPDQRLSRSLRHGERPRVLTVPADDVGARLSELVAELAVERPGELVGVVVAAGRARAVETALEGTGTTVVPAPDARGLEFDTVVIVDPAGIRAAGDAGLRDLYVAQTRATKHLVSLELAGAPQEGSGAT